MLTLDTATITAALSSEAAIISLYDVSYNEVNQTTGAKTPKVLYMTDHAEAVTYNSNVYNPAVIKRTGVSTNAEGESEPITISIGNIFLFLFATFFKFSNLIFATSFKFNNKLLISKY